MSDPGGDAVSDEGNASMLRIDAKIVRYVLDGSDDVRLQFVQVQQNGRVHDEHDVRTLTARLQHVRICHTQ